MFQTKILIYHSKANSDKKILLGKITHHEVPTITKMSVRGLYRNREFHFPFRSMIYEAMKFTLSVSEIEFQLQ